MKIIAIESSCDETAASVCEGRTVCSSVVASQVEEHRLYGGVVPEIASRRHAESISQVVRQALDQAGLPVGQMDAIAVTSAPGLIGALLVGVNFAKGLAADTGLPLVSVHHLRSHIAANYITHPDLKPPFLSLVVSGGHSHLVLVEDYTRFRVVGHTRDDAAGECFDKTARAMGLDYPGGIRLDAIAQGGDASRYSLPKPHVDTPYDFSFSGLKTAVINLIHTAQQRGEAVSVPDLAASVRKCVCDLLIEKTLKAAQDYSQKTIVLAGGVSANSELRARMRAVCEENGFALSMPELCYCGDNAAMVGVQGYYEFLAGNRASLSLNARATADIAEF